MNDTEKILKAITHLSTAVQSLTKGQTEQDKKLDSLTNDIQEVKQVQLQTNEILAHQSTAIETLAEGQQALREEVIATKLTMATKADVLQLGEKINKNNIKTKIRLKHLEEHTKTTDPTEN